MNLFAVLPAFNEAENLKTLLQSLVQLKPKLDPKIILRVLVIDDGSSDGTGMTAEAFSEKLNLTVISHASNQGFSKALRNGLNKALALWKAGGSSPEDAVVVMDADNTHSPDFIL